MRHGHKAGLMYDEDMSDAIIDSRPSSEGPPSRRSDAKMRTRFEIRSAAVDVNAGANIRQLAGVKMRQVTS